MSAGGSAWADSRRAVHEVVDCGRGTVFLCTHVSRGRDPLEVRQPLGLIYRTKRRARSRFPTDLLG